MRLFKHYIALALMSFCYLTSYAHDFEVDGIYYNITSRTNLTCEVTFKGTEASVGGTYNIYGLEVPSEVTINGVTFTVTSIGDYAFYNCTNYNVKMPNTIERIGKYAFASRQDLRLNPPGIIIPYSVREIDDHAYSGRHFLGNVSFESPSRLERIGNYAFYDTRAYLSLKKLDSVVEIGDFAFYCLYNNIYLALIDLSLGDNVKRIGNYAFNNCIVKTLTLPTSVEYIGDCAFHNCFADEDGWDHTISSSNHSYINIPKTTKYIGINAFSGPRYSLNVNEENENYCAESDVLFSKDKSKLISFPEKTTGFYIIPETITEICEDAFYKSKLNSIKIPASTKIIGRNAFSGSEFNRLVIPNTVDPVSLTISDMQNLSEIVIDVKYIGEFFVSNCKNLRTITLGPNVETIANDHDNFYTAFYDTGINKVINLSSHHISDYNCNALKRAQTKYEGCEILDEQFAVYKDGDNLMIVSYLNNDVAINIPEVNSGNIKIGSTAFSNCSQFKEIKVNIAQPPSCELGAFSGVDKLNCKLFVPKESIEEYAKAEGWKDFWNILPIGSEATDLQNLETKNTFIVESSDNSINISGISKGERIHLYSVDGMLLDNIVVGDTETSLGANLAKGRIYVVKIGKRAIKYKF